ncbi:zinc finger protein-domain-containing protein [Rhypophila decipiens]|uniref:Zinc finger protein-domain-containing protein n=1 Tax=Rhypophila decipiens TaxID=261697 RepID=A0AAN6Y0G7_9PEZI|nr:zinc finger protein-domain-containing protein [Rhypophila decipiens]
MALSPREILSHALSLRPLTEQTTATVHDWPTSTFRKIGFGQCGLVFTVPDQPHTVLKVARPYFGESLYADFLAHQSVESAFARRSDAVQSQVQLPSEYDFLPKPQPGLEGWSSQQWWDSNISLFPPSTASAGGSGTGGASRYSTFHLPSEAVFTEHIPPLSKPIREALIDLYCAPAKQASVRADPANQDCLLRVYLGRRRPRDENGQPKVVANFGLRNYNLHLDQMLELGLDVHLFAQMMGAALADIHWGAGVDAFDVEFVLGGRRTVGLYANTDGAADLWLLDFNLCSRFNLDELLGDQHDGLVEQLVHAFFANDPYYPRPRTQGEKGCEEGDISLWQVFANAYLDRADEILRSENRPAYEDLRRLPERFITGCIVKQKTLPPGVDKIGVD